MGMFDYYEATDDLRCPQCGANLGEWQGKNGPNELLLWKQGYRSPIGHQVDKEILELSATDGNDPTLPLNFEIHTICVSCSKRVEAVGQCIDGIWTSSTVLSH
jgi:DNA-directed RNA polymerase subunit RPC12/RpoP